VAVGVGIGVAVSVGIGVAVAEGIGVEVGFSVGMGVKVGWANVGVALGSRVEEARGLSNGDGASVGRGVAVGGGGAIGVCVMVRVEAVVNVGVVTAEVVTVVVDCTVAFSVCWRLACCSNGAAWSGSAVPSFRSSTASPEATSTPLIPSCFIVILPCARDVPVPSLHAARFIVLALIRIASQI
jgi:hypothetical protein